MSGAARGFNRIGCVRGLVHWAGRQGGGHLALTRTNSHPPGWSAAAHDLQLAPHRHRAGSPWPVPRQPPRPSAGHVSPAGVAGRLFKVSASATAAGIRAPQSVLHAAQASAACAGLPDRGVTPLRELALDQVRSRELMLLLLSSGRQAGGAFLGSSLRQT